MHGYSTQPPPDELEAERQAGAKLRTDMFDLIFPDREESALQQWARDEIARVGLSDPDSDYDGMLGTAVMQLIKLFAAQGHSGFSAGLTIEAFKRLASYQHLNDDEAPLPDLEPAE